MTRQIQVWVTEEDFKRLKAQAVDQGIKPHGLATLWVLQGLKKKKKVKQAESKILAYEIKTKEEREGKQKRQGEGWKQHRKQWVAEQARELISREGLASVSGILAYCEQQEGHPQVDRQLVYRALATDEGFKKAGSRMDRGRLSQMWAWSDALG